MLDRIKNKTNATIKKLLTLVMALAMTITCIPTMAFAAENSEQVNKNLMVPDTYKLSRQESPFYLVRANNKNEFCKEKKI